MRLAFSTLACPNWTLEEMARCAAEYGYEAAELSPRHPTGVSPALTAGERQQVRNLFASHGVEIAMVNTYSEFIEPEAEVRARNVAMVKAFVDLARDLGTTRVRVFGQNTAKELPSDIPRDRCMDYVATAIMEIAAYAVADDIEILLETHDVFRDPELVTDVMRRISAPNVGVVWDITNSVVMGSSVDEAFAAVRDSLRFVQVKDYMETRRMESPCLIGTGDAPNKEAFALLRAAGYRGYVSLETEKMYHPEPETPDADESFPQFAEYMRLTGALA